jgi:hypothetical protein
MQRTYFENFGIISERNDLDAVYSWKWARRLAMNLLVDHEYSVMNIEVVYWVIAQSLSLE